MGETEMVRGGLRNIISDIVITIESSIYDRYRGFSLVLITLATILSFTIKFTEQITPGIISLLALAWFIVWHGSHYNNLINEHSLRLQRDYEKFLIERLNKLESEVRESGNK